MAKSGDKAAKAEARELARLEKRLDKARAVETKRTRKAAKASDRVTKLAGKVAARRDGSADSEARDADAADVPVTDTADAEPTAELADGAAPAGTGDVPARNAVGEAHG